MEVVIHPSIISGTITAPPSKSITHRAIIAASLATGTSVIKNILISDDTNHTINACIELGANITQHDSSLTIVGTGGKLICAKNPIFVGDSGTTLRLLSAVSSISPYKTIISGSKRLFERPITELIAALNKQGANVAKITNTIKISGSKPSGGKIKISGKKTSQFVSALCLIAPLAKKDTCICITDKLKSQPYVELTLETMKAFGIIFETKFRGEKLSEIIIPNNQQYKAQKNFEIKGDFSSVSYFFAANALGANISVQGLNKESVQADARFPGIIKSTLNEIDMSDMPDVVPTLAVVAAFKKGKTIIKNIAHLRKKETDRIDAISCELSNMGIQTITTDNSLSIVGGNPHGAIINTYNDHRMAMSFAIAALFAKGKTIINNAEVTNKSYPRFWRDLHSLGANVKVDTRDQNIVLIGMRGSGKSTIGKLVANKLHQELIEMDKVIEKKEGKSVSQIVEKNGWNYFRKIEKQICQKIACKKNFIIATGGGVILDVENVRNLKNHGILIYLKADIGTLAKRIRNGEKRPLLTDAKNMHDDMKQIFQKRKHMYEIAADFVINTNGKTEKKVVEEILTLIQI